MEKIAVEQAVGKILCHDITAIRPGFKGPAFRRGHRITPEDVPALLDIGKRHIYVGELPADEIHEEDAARRLAALAAVEGGEFSGPSEGKMVLTAKHPGLLRVNVPLLRQIDSIGDITIATLPDHYPIAQGGRIASMRIVPLTTKTAQIERAEALCRESGTPLLRLLPYRTVKAGLIITGSEIYSGRIPDRFEPVLRGKLRPFGAEVLGCRFCDDDCAMIQNAIEDFFARGAQLILLTGGMSVDPDDVTPAAVRASGAKVVRHGVPSQPGNMLMLAYRGETALVGVPGAAVHTATTTLDVILPQLIAGERITEADLVALGDGGFCQGCGECRWPNCTFGRY